MRRLRDDLERQGHRPFAAPIGIQLNERDPASSACNRCNTCDGFPCLVNAKADADVLCVRTALQQPNVTLLTRTLVQRLEPDPSGRSVTRVAVERNGESEEFSGDVAVLSCG